ncbi:molybdopterin converting factor subunit 1 [Chryseobacterium sp. c4a]|uniref:molybdopterin converting factor subunit 1 n=1 Tax=Chryseobacterium sp. c4a TaxID=1573582 RepID=UPI001358C22F|nr:molybdopterin converting factor subunit 1 [Chryseobacterium sp. c4a]
MKLNILTFGITKDIFEAPEKELEVKDNLTVKELKDILETDFPQLITLKSYFIAVNEEYAEDDQIIVSTDEIAIIPPVSGG